MLRRTGFKRKEYQRPPPSALAPLTRRVHLAIITGTPTPAPKETPVRSESYRRLVAALPCKHCGISGYSQAAHPNTGKGMGLKTDDRLSFPLCSPRPTGAGIVAGCHALFDQGALFPKRERQAIEIVWGAETRQQIQAAGAWPKGLPLYG